ncbi:hypothetical protein O4O04_01795 [Leptospira sp. GIMC2001]|nr:hypothetical protein [Leptospira sp. GIMC2001]WCL49574.1 hypothetical protein O4O04_01795 [Leptospira sp. GIMC2001]
MDKIESRLQERNISKEDVERVSKLKFSPFTTHSSRKFDPSLAANLFEKGISTPKFSNPKLWFLVGPLRWMLEKFVNFYALVDKKLSENRVRSFLQVLHEIVVIRKQQDLLAMKMEEFYQEYAENKYQAAKGMTQRTLYSPLFTRVDFDSGVPPESEELLGIIQENQPVLIYYPSSLAFLEYCNSQNLKYRVITPFEEDVTLIRRSVTEFVTTNTKVPPNTSVLFHANACLFPSGFWEGLLREWKSLESDTRFLIRFRDRSTISLSPFQDNLPMRIDILQLSEYLKSIGFKNIHIHDTNQWGWTLVSFINSLQ